MEDKLIALNTTCLEVEWLKNLIYKFSFVRRLVPSNTTLIDSRSAIELLKQVNVN